MLNRSLWIAFNNTFTLQHIPFDWFGFVGVAVEIKGESEGAEWMNPTENISMMIFFLFFEQ